jgi:hypothetical protein
MKNIKSFFSICLLFAVLFIAVSCNKEKYSEIPALTFERINKFKKAKPIGNVTDSIEVEMIFTDGDGNIGRKNDSEVLTPDTKSITYNVFKKVSSEWVKDTIDYDNLLPILNASGTKKALKGIITIDVTVALINFSKRDSVRLEFYLIDHAKNKSNTIVTNSINGIR